MLLTVAQPKRKHEDVSTATRSSQHWAELRIQTVDDSYWLTYMGATDAQLRGTHKFCRTAIPVSLLGSRWLGTPVKQTYIAPEMHLHVPWGELEVVTTSMVAVEGIQLS